MLPIIYIAIVIYMLLRKEAIDIISYPIVIEKSTFKLSPKKVYKQAFQ